MDDRKDFREIAHSGGKLIITVKVNSEGRQMYQITWQHSRPVPFAGFAVYALSPGIILCQINLRGLGSRQDPPPIAGAYQVFIGSDSEGKFGRQCPACGGDWRADLNALFCPYCGISASVIDFLTIAQRSYVKEYCAKMDEALQLNVNGEYVIDMDAVADAANASNGEKPRFYYAELSQQNTFTCNACGGFNDILGTFGYCTVCCTRNDLQELSDQTIQSLRDRINAGGQYEACVRDSIAAFDSFVSQYVKQLVKRIPLTPARRNRLENGRFHNLQVVATELKETFDIDILEGLAAEDIAFAKLMFHRRHVYEHGGGEADEKYLADSGDKTVKLKQTLRETVESAHQIAGIVVRMASNLHNGFHEIFPPEERPIEEHREKLELVRSRLAARN
jgi:hypothetical protein